MACQDWAKIHRRDNGNAAGSLINPEPVKHSRNHLHANLKGLREQAKQVRDKKMEAAAGPKPAFRMKEFVGVEGKVAKNLPERDPQRVVEFMKKGEGNLAQPKVEQRLMPREPKEQYRPDVPKAAEAEPVAKCAPKNHILVNRLCAEQRGHERRAPAAPVEDRLKKNFGKVPKYLTVIKDDLDDRKRAAALAAQKEDIPPGYRLLGEEERLEMLGALQEKLAEANDRYRKLPLKVESERAKRAQKDLETKMDDLEKAVTMFSKPKVLLEE